MDPAPVRRVAEIASFHAHVYYDPENGRPDAEAVRSAVAERFAVQLGRWREGPVGPHSRAMFQIAFPTDLFGTLVPWLMLNNRGLSILIHPNTTNPKRDHLIDAMWIGAALDLHGDVLPDEGEAEPAGAPNTEPSLEP
jgi:DOPA 4,5-dioxygenase